LQVWEDCDGAIPFAAGGWLEETRIEYEDDYAYYVHAGLLPGKSLVKRRISPRCGEQKAFLRVDMTGESQSCSVTGTSLTHSYKPTKFALIREPSAEEG